jgi:hypothetical protein
MYQVPERLDDRKAWNFKSLKAIILLVVSLSAININI